MLPAGFFFVSSFFAGFGVSIEGSVQPEPGLRQASERVFRVRFLFRSRFTAWRSPASASASRAGPNRNLSFASSCSFELERGGERNRDSSFFPLSPKRRDTVCCSFFLLSVFHLLGASISLQTYKFLKCFFLQGGKTRHPSPPSEEGKKTSAILFSHQLFSQSADKQVKCCI